MPVHMGTSCGMFFGMELVFGSQPRNNADCQLVNTKAISASHEAMHMVMIN